MKNSLLLAVLISFFNFAHSQDITGEWYANLKVSGMEIPLVFHIEEDNSNLSATLDSPKQNAYGLKGEEASFENSILKITFPGAGITYEGHFNEEDQTFKGTFKQGAASLPLDLFRDETEANNSRTEKPLRSQEPKAPFGYISENVSFTNNKDNITLAGTLTLPEGSGKFPAVVLISGSGPQDRNSEVFGHRPFLVIADHLTKNGIAVLRYDERGVKESEGDFSQATSRDLAGDVMAAVNFLRSRNEVDQEMIGLIGHSEGGIIAPMVAEKSEDVDYIILLAGQGLRGDRNLLLQKKLFEQRSGYAEVDVEQGQTNFEGAYKIIREEEGEDLQAKLKTYAQQKFSEVLNDNQLNILVQQLTSPWIRFYLKHDPSPVLENIKIPVLALFGEKDFQVPPDENAQVVRESLERAGNNKVEIKVFEDLNHLFQESNTGLPDEYEQIEQTISPEVLQKLSSWILEQK